MRDSARAAKSWCTARCTPGIVYQSISLIIIKPDTFHIYIYREESTELMSWMADATRIYLYIRICADLQIPLLECDPQPQHTLTNPGNVSSSVRYINIIVCVSVFRLCVRLPASLSRVLACAMLQYIYKYI